MEEIEILVEVLEDMSSVLKKVEHFADFQCIQQVHDIYYNKPDDRLLSPDTDGRLLNSLRIRKKNDISLVAFKKDHFNENNIWLYSDEFETKVGDFDILQRIFENLGYNILVEVKNTKHTYKYDNFEIVVEDVLNLGTYLEVEYIGNEVNEVGNIKDQISQIIYKMNIRVSDELNCGKPELMLKKLRT